MSLLLLRVNKVKGDAGCHINGIGGSNNSVQLKNHV